MMDGGAVYGEADTYNRAAGRRGRPSEEGGGEEKAGAASRRQAEAAPPDPTRARPTRLASGLGEAGGAKR
ncbi:hypothetical protein HRG14_12000, partial [Paenibacillus dendritiformis]|nr:hypothetical protein [Paenibacillus dendritiformis]